MKRQIIKWLLYSLWTLLLFAIQSALGDRISIAGIKPNLMPFLVCTMAMLEGEKKGAWYGFFVGLLCDAFHPASTGFFPVVYFGCAYGVGILTKRYFSTNYLTAALFGTVVSIVTNVLQYVIFYMIFDRVAAVDMLYIVGVEAVYSLAVSVFAYAPLRWCIRLTRDRQTEYRRMKNRYK